MNCRLSCLLVLTLLISASGCRTWWQDDRPMPTKPPYEQKKTSSCMTEEQIINKIVTDIALKIAVSENGPYQIIAAGKLSVVGTKVLESLRQMGVIRPFASITLTLCEEKTPEKWMIYIPGLKKEEYFYKYLINEKPKGKSHGS